MSIRLDTENGRIFDTRCQEDLLFCGDSLGVCYTLMSDDITRGKKPSATPYKDRLDAFRYTDGGWYADETETSLRAETFGDGLLFEMESPRTDLSEYGIHLPFNFMGKRNGGGWENQFLFNSPYRSPDRRVIYAYLTKPNGNHLAVAITGEADGWKMDYSPYLWAHYFVSLKLLANYDRAYGTPDRPKKLSFAILPVSDFGDCLEKLSRLFGIPMLNFEVGGGAVGEEIPLMAYGEPDGLIERHGDREVTLPFPSRYLLRHEGEVELTPVRDGVRGAPVTVYGYRDLFSLYKKSMESVNPDVIARYTDGNLCEHQCWASAMLRFLRRHRPRLTEDEVCELESKLRPFLATLTETDEAKAVPRQTIFHLPHEGFPAYNVYRSRRVQELFFGITILLDAYLYFGDERYYRYAVGATDCLISHYQKEDGRLEVDWGNHAEDYTTVCCAMIPLCDMANFVKDRDPERSARYRNAADRMAAHVYARGMKFPTEGGKTEIAEEEMEDGSIACTALTLLYYCRNIERNEAYIEKAKAILDIHDSWIIRTPVCQMHGSTLRWWETQWEGDADGPAICAGHAWSIWRAEADYLYYALTGDREHLIRAKNGFMTNLSKIQSDGKSYSIYNPDEINGGGFHGVSDEIRFRLANRYADREDCGISRYVWIRINDTFLKE